MLKSNFPTKPVQPDEQKIDPHEQFLEKAKESIGGSMVFVERKRLYYDPLSETPKSDS